jgi:hypothetical protein
MAAFSAAVLRNRQDLQPLVQYKQQVVARRYKPLLISPSSNYRDGRNRIYASYLGGKLINPQSYCRCSR